MQIVIFRLSQKYFAIETDSVVEITKILPAIHVPNSPYGVEGLVNLRGYVVAQINLSKLLHLEEDLCYNNAIIVHNDDHKIGLLVNDVVKVMDLDESLIQLVDKGQQKGIRGIVELDGTIVNVFHVKELLSEKEGSA